MRGVILGKKGERRKERETKEGRRKVLHLLSPYLDVSNSETVALMIIFMV